MKGDFSRFTFDPEKKYNSVLLQQGRVVLDADWNEQGDIQKHIRETEALDVIGRCGGPIDNAGFKVEVDQGGRLTLSPGRMYVDGKLCELAGEDPRDAQPIVGDEGPGTYLAYLDVWDRHITAVEDDDIREKALGGPDTATRVKTEWLVKLKKCDLDPENVSCLKASLELKKEMDPGDSRLAVRLHPPEEESAADPCAILSGRAYRGLENQLYRVEVHEPGEVREATFKWSRNNGSIAFGIVDFIEDESEDEGSEISEASKERHRIRLKQLGWDQELRIHKDDWVEVLGDETELLGLQGTLARVEEIDESDMILTLTGDVAKHKDESNPKVRRWDLKESGLEESQLVKGIPAVADSDDEPDSDNGGWIKLEDGIEVSFKAGDIYRTGDFWLIPARNTGEIEWPFEETDFVPKFGIHHHNCLLAILSHGEGTWNIERDCRKLFPPLADMVLLSYVGGDGQEAMPGEELPAPLQISIQRGGRPVEGAEVNFKISKGNGKIRDKSQGDYADEMTVTTGDDGIAECIWKFGDDQPEWETEGEPGGDLIWTEQVEAALLYPEQEHPPSIQFNANAAAASLSYVGGDGQEAMPGEGLPAPLQVRVFLGGYPLKNAKVEFEIVEGNGKIREKQEDDYADKITVTTDGDGIASCLWKFGEDRPHGDRIWTEQVRSALVKPGQKHPPFMLFSARAVPLSLSCVGGDGQEAMPGDRLPAPLQVRATRGEPPVEGADIRFEILEGQGVLDPPSGSVRTGKDGMAQCFCRLEEVLESPRLRVRAMLMDVVSPDEEGGPSHPSIFFNANASVAEEVAYDPASCPHLGDARTVQAAIDGLCKIIQAETARVVWVHGNSLQIYNLEGELSVKRQGSGAVVSGVTGSKALIHLSIPTTQAPAKDMPIAHEVLIRFKSSSKSVIRAASVYDGETMIFEATELEAPTSWETIRIGPIDKPILTGVGISIQIEVYERVSQIEFSAAGCQFSAYR